MKHITHTLLFVILCAIGLAASAQDYRPDTPPEPGFDQASVSTNGMVTYRGFTPGNLGTNVKATLQLQGISASSVHTIIVQGKLNTDDLKSIAELLPACTTWNISGTTGIQALTAMPEGNVVETLFLPESVLSFGKEALANCTRLRHLYIYNATPPRVSESSFAGIPDAVTLHVTPQAYENYMVNMIWTSAFALIQPLENMGQVLVTLPKAGVDGRFKGMSLVFKNKDNGQTYRYLVKSQMEYTFYCAPDTRWHVTLVSPSGQMLTEMDDIELTDGMAKVDLPTASPMYRADVRILTPDGKDVTDQTTIKWYSKNPPYSLLGEASYVENLCLDEEVRVNVSLNSDELLRDYLIPEATTFSTSEKRDNYFRITLRPMPHTRVVGEVKTSVKNTQVTVTQKVQGKQFTFQTTTDAKGHYELDIRTFPFTISASNPLAFEVVREIYYVTGDIYHMEPITLSDIEDNATTDIHLDLSYQPIGVGGQQEPDVQPILDVKDLVFRVYDTKGEVTGVLSNYPILSVNGAVYDGVILKVNISSASGRFEETDISCTVKENAATLKATLTERGGFRTTVKRTDCTSLVGLLFRGDEFVGKYNYKDASLRKEHLPMGDYSLVSMASDAHYNSFTSLSHLKASGLVQDKDYVITNLAVKPGTFLNVDIPVVPVLTRPASILGEDTRFEANKDVVALNTLVTMSARLDIQPQALEEADWVTMLVHLPLNVTYVQASTMVGDQVWGSVYVDRGTLSISVPKDKADQSIRFCVKATESDVCHISSELLVLKGVTVLHEQPIGSTTFTAGAFTIQAPSTTSVADITIRGEAPADAMVDVYANKQKLGTAVANQAGKWELKVNLGQPYNLTQFSIHAVAQTPAGNVLETAPVTCTFDVAAPQLLNVTMKNLCGQVSSTFGNVVMNNIVEQTTIFDFQTLTTSRPYYVYYPAASNQFKFFINFDNPEAVDNVRLRIFFLNGSSTTVRPERMDLNDRKVWYYNYEDNGQYPVNVNVTYESKVEGRVDSRIIPDAVEAVAQSVSNVQEMMQDIETRVQELTDLKQALNEPDLDPAIEALSSQLQEEQDPDRWEELFTQYLSLFPHEPGPAFSTTEEWEAALDEVLSQPLPEVDYDKQALMEMVDSMLLEHNECLDYAHGAILKMEPDGFIVKDDSISYSMRVMDISQVPAELLAQEGGSTLTNTDGEKMRALVGDDGMYIINETTGMVFFMDCSAIEEQLNRIRRKGLGDDVVGTLTSVASWLSYGVSNTLSALEYELKLESTQVGYWQEMIVKYQREVTYYTEQAAKAEAELKKLTMIMDAPQGVGTNLMDTWQKRRDMEIRFKDLTKQKEFNEKEIKVYQRRIADLDFTVSKGLTRVAFLTSAIGAVSNIATMVKGIYDEIEDIKRWDKFIDNLEPCPGHETEVEMIRESAEDIFFENKVVYTLNTTKDVAFSVSSTLAVFAGFTAAASKVVLTRVLAEGTIEMAATLVSSFFGGVSEQMERSQRVYASLTEAYRKLNCRKNTGDDDDDDPEPKKPVIRPSLKPIIDPSGYVYEAVPSNRLEGVRATIYYRENEAQPEADATLWDAEAFDQHNPLYTDSEGMYQWDVPEGLWQVRFEKTGYEPTRTEWLPVPPPQLDINVPMTQLHQPQVMAARATQQWVEVTFDKYMQTSTLTPEHIYVSILRDGQSSLLRDASILLMDAEGDEAREAQYARTARLMLPQGALLPTDEVRLVVQYDVTSYAGIMMQDNFVQVLDVEPAATEVVVEPVIHVGRGQSHEVRLGVLPVEAARGRTLHIDCVSEEMLTMHAQGQTSAATVTILLDENGEGTLSLDGILPGRTALNMLLEEDGLRATTFVEVVDPAALAPVATPTASRISGTEVYTRQGITFSCATPGATIWYTTDGSCPCEPASSIRYDGTPILVDHATTFRVMAVGINGAESDVATFTYDVASTALTLQVQEGWNWLSHNAATPLSMALLQQPQVSQVLDADEVADPRQAVRLRASEPFSVPLSGPLFYPYGLSTSLSEGINWVGYPLSQLQTPAEALRLFSADEGDCIVSLTSGFAVYDGDAWRGTLTALVPGEGYALHTSVAKDFIFDQSIVSSASRQLVAKRHAQRRALRDLPVVAPRLYPDVMCLTAQLLDDGTPVEAEQSVLLVFDAEGVCRGTGEWQDGLLYVSIHGDAQQTETLQLMLSMPDSEEFLPVGELPFSASVVGTPSVPHPLELTSTADAIATLPVATSAADGIYSLSGMRLTPDALRRPGIYLIRRAGRYQLHRIR